MAIQGKIAILSEKNRLRPQNEKYAAPPITEAARKGFIRIPQKSSRIPVFLRKCIRFINAITG